MQQRSRKLAISTAHLAFLDQVVIAKGLSSTTNALHYVLSAGMVEGLHLITEGEKASVS